MERKANRQGGAPVTDTCGWSALAGRYREYPAVTREVHADWAVIGGGGTGLAAARRLAELDPQARIVLLDAKRIAQGASARNSGFVVANESPGHARLATKSGRRDYAALNRLDHAGVAELRRLTQAHRIECQWEDTGSIHAAADPAAFEALRAHAANFIQLGLHARLIESDALAARLGTTFYGLGVLSEGGALVQPAMLVKGLADTMPAQIELFENSPVTRLTREAGQTVLHLPGARLTARRVIVGLNAFLPRLGLARDRVFPLALTASLTRPLSAEEEEELGHAPSWGVLSARKLGATMRLTRDRRLMIRNTAEYRPGGISPRLLAARRQIHAEALARRFPWLGADAITHSWSGTTSVSRNSKPVFGELSEGVFVAGCYNASGVARGAVLGRLIAEMAMGGSSDLLSTALSLTKPGRLPPRPFLDIGVRARLMFERRAARRER